MRTDAQKRAHRNYIKSLDVITLKVPKEKGLRIRAKAEKAGKSVTKYIMDILEDQE